jgi:phage tail-like protein
MADEQVHGGYHVVVDIPDVADDLLFYECTPPSASLDLREFKTWDANGLPTNTLGGGRQVTWSPVTLSRGIDQTNALWEWFKEIREKGATEDTKKDVMITVMGEDGETEIHTWNLMRAVITSYNHTAHSAQGNDVLVQRVELKYEDATLEQA